MATVANESRTPINTLPPELLAHTFLLAREEEQVERLHETDGCSPGTATCQHVFSSISPYFRNVALGTAALWTSVTVTTSTPSGKVQAFCGRSLGAPLNIRVELGSTWLNNTQAVAAVFDNLRTVASHSHRWRKLVISLSRDVLHESVVRFLCGHPAPMLESLDLLVESVDILDVALSHISPRSPNIFTRDTINISFLRFRGMAVHFFRPYMGQLTVLHLEQTNAIPIKYATFKELLEASFSLTHLSVCGDILDDADRWPSPTALTPDIAVHLPTLQSLRLRGKDSPVYEGIVRTIDAPQLCSIILKGMHDDDLCWARFQPCAALSQVTELTFWDFDLSERAYRSIFLIFPSIQSFHLHTSTIGTSNLSVALSKTHPSYPSASHTPWPELHLLALGFDDRDDCLFVHDLLHARKLLGRPLVELQFATLELQLLRRWLRKAKLQRRFGIRVTTTDGLERWPPSNDIPVEYWDLDDHAFHL